MRLNRNTRKQNVFQFKFISDYFQIKDARGPVLAANQRAKWLSQLCPDDLRIAFAMYKGQVPMYGAEYVELVDRREAGWWNHYFFNSWQLYEQEKGATGWSVGPNIDLTKPLTAMVLLVVNSNYQKRLVLRKWTHYDPDLITVIPNMVDNTLFSPGERSEQITIGWIGYDNPSKYTKGVEVIPFLAKRFPHLNFEMVHAAEPQFQYEWMKEPLPNVKIYHNIAHVNMPDLVRKWHVLISGSKWETGATHVMEAMACGIPVIAADVAVFPEVASSQLLLKDMKIGHPPHTTLPYQWTDPSLERYAQALNELISDADKLKKLSLAAIEESKATLPPKIAEQWFRFMRKCRDCYQLS
ncbi:Glycosyl transferases group 1 [compost metagenome]